MKDVNQVADNTLDSLNKARTARPIAGASRKGNHPVLFLVGKAVSGSGAGGDGEPGAGSGIGAAGLQPGV